jgi:hypothetical protein
MLGKERQCVKWSCGTCKMLLQWESTETNMITTNELENEYLCYCNKVYIYLFNKHNGNIWN